MKKETDVSIVIPVYGCHKSLMPLYQRISNVFSKIELVWELILINDGAGDESWEIIEELAFNDYRIKGIDLSRNFGQHAAISAGLDNILGEKVIVMDCDLQDQPEEIPNLISKHDEGYDVVLARRNNRKDGYFKRMSSKVFYSVLSFLTGQEYDPAIANFGCYSKKVIQAVNNMGDYKRMFPIFVKWVGFKVAYINVNHSSREFGKTTYSLGKLFSLALNSMLSFSDRPLKIAVKIGFLLSTLSLFVAFLYFLGAIKGLFIVEGWATIVISQWFLSGLIILILGIVGLYISKIFEQTKNRPLYIIKNKLNVEK